MGRLMLNVLLSFAQFEREVTGERIRDKIAASKRKGIWMGGTPPIGYALKDQKLLVDHKQAKVVRHIFHRYAALRSVAKLCRELQAQGYRTKPFTSLAGRAYGGKAFTRGHLYRVLQNRVYLGEVIHKDKSHPGEHAAIIERVLWDKVQRAMASNRRAALPGVRCESNALLKGLVFDDAGNRMSPAHANRGGRRYRYYVSQALLQQRKEDAGSLPAPTGTPFRTAGEHENRRSVGKGRTDQGCADQTRLEQRPRSAPAVADYHPTHRGRQRSGPGPARSGGGIARPCPGVTA
jgi:hypothetical protein